MVDIRILSPSKVVRNGAVLEAPRHDGLHQLKNADVLVRREWNQKLWIETIFIAMSYCDDKMCHSVILINPTLFIIMGNYYHAIHDENEP